MISTCVGFHSTLTNPPQAHDTHSAVGQLVSTQPQSSPCAPPPTDGKYGEKKRDRTTGKDREREVVM